ncbi:MAG: leukotoxin LktA family filamentous adhesin [Dialister sp.]|nr:leukotoxin LktA family filamentous adhesin [Dialister sp.]
MADQKHYGNTVKVTDIANSGKQYDIKNQQVKDGNALNKFEDFGIKQHDVANLHMEKANHQINVVKNKIDIDGVVNAIKDNKIGGDVYFFSDAGIAVGANGVFNVGRLTLGTNAAYGEALYNGGMEKHLAQSAASQAKAVAGGSDITLQGKVYAQSDVVLGAGSVNVKGGEIRTHRNNADTYADKKAAEAYRNQLVNVSPSATVAKALGHGDIALAAVGASSVAKPFETKGAIVIDQAYMDAAGGDTSVIASAERNGGNLMGSKADASVEISNATIQGQNVAISAETKVSGKVGSADAYKTGAEEDGILGLLHVTFDEQVGSLASVVKTGADSRVTVKDSTLTAAKDLAISSKAESEIGSETGGALGVGINVGIADVSSKVEIQEKSVLTAGKDLAISAEGSNAIDLQRQGSAEDLPIAIDLGWAEAKTDASVTVAKEATLKAKEKVDVSAKAERNLSVEVENSSGDGTLGLAVGVIQSETKATADVQGKVYADGKVSVSAENTVSDEDGKYDPDTLHITSESESDDGTSSDPIHDIVDVATTKGKGNQLMAGIKKLWGDKSTEKKAADAGTTAADQTAATSTGGGLGLNAATAFLFSDNSAKASLSGEVRDYDGASGAGAVDVHAETLSRTKVKAGVSQGADKSAGIAAAVNYIDQNDKAEAELAGDIKSKGNVDVSAETKRPWQSNLEGFGENLADDLKTIFDPNDGFELSYLTDSWTQTGGAGEKVSGAAALNIMEYNHTAKATVKKDTKVEIDNGDLAVSAKNDIHTVNFSGDIKAPIGDQPGSLDFWEDIGGSPFSGGGKAALGGAALTVHQKNTAEATVADNVTVTQAKDVSVTAENKGSNLSIAGAGGKGQTVAVDGTVNINRFENTTKATVGKATINADGDVSVNAEDNSKTINIGGAIAVSGQAGIGATVAYNHIDRQTEASLQGKVTSTKDVSVTAKNTGAVYAMSAAGGVTMDSTEANGAGSTGLKAQEGADGQSTSSIGELAEKLLNAGKSDKDKKEIQKGDSALDNIAGKDASMGENVGAAKGGFAAAANVSVNRITDTAKAYTKGSTVSADSLAIRSGNDSKITTGAGAIALGLSQNSQAIAGSFMYNAITDKNEAYAEDATLSLTGSEKDDTSLTVEADNAAKITNIAASGSGASKGSAVAGQISLNWVDNTTDAHVKGGSLKAGKAATISAKDRGNINSYTGAVAISPGNNGAAVGASIAANLIKGETTSSLEDTTVNSGGALSVTADEASQITSIVAAGAASGKFAGAFSASGNYIHTDTDAHISNKNEMKTGALSVLAKNGSNATIGVGSAAIGGNTAGASIGVMVNQSAVSASLTGDEAKKKTITADGITVKADNAYNGDASDTDQTAKTVAVGFAGGTSQFAGSGSVTVNVINQTTDATVGKGVYDAGKKAVKVEATSAAKLFGLAGGVSLSAGSGLGAAVDVQTYKGHTYAGIADGASLKNASFVTVNADSKEHLTSVAATLAGGAGTFAGAGAAGAHSVSTDTKAYVGQSEVTDAGDVSVTAKDETELNTIAGSGAASGNTGVGLTAAVEVVNKKASAIVGDNAKVTGRSLTVKAENTSSSVTSAAGLGVGGTAGLAGAASETFVNQETDAHVGKNANVNVEKGAEILANSTFTQGATAGSVGGGGTVGIGISNATVSLNAVTKAYADDGAVISGGNQVKISADHATNLTYATVAGGVGGTVGVSGNAAVNIIDTETKAYTGESSALSADETGDGISITASDTTELHGGNGGTAIGISGGGAGVAVGVTNLKKNTSAYADQNAKLDSQGQVAISATNKEDIDNVTVQVAGGTYAGLAGAVNVMNLSASTKAYTDTGVQINQANKASGRYGGNVSVKADHALKMTSAVGGAAASGGASGGAAVDVANIKTQTNAYIGDSNTIDTKGDVSASAKDEVTLNSHAYAASIGAVGLSGSISVYSIGSASFDDKDNILSGKNADGQDEDLTTWVNGQVNQSKTKDAMKAYDGKTGALSDVKKELGTTYASQEPTTEEKGTLAKIGKGTTITADGNVSVDAADTLNMQNYMSSITGSAFASAGASVSVVNTDTQTKALIDSDAKIAAGKDLAVKSKAAHQMDQKITGASVSGGVSGQGTVATWNDRSDVSALIGASRGIGANNVTVTSENDRTLKKAYVAGASVALGAVNGSVIVANTSGSSTAGVGDESKENTAGEGVTAQKAITISANADTNLDATAIGAAAGVFAGDGTGVRLSSDTDAKAFVGKKEKLNAGTDLSVTAKNTPKISALSTSAAVGLAGVGITVASISSGDSAHVSVGDSASLTAGKALTIKASMDKPASGSNMEANAIAGGGGVVSGAVADVRVNLDQKTDVSIGKNAVLKGKTADISAAHQSASALAMESVAAGYYSGTGGETRFSETSGVSVSVGDGTTIETEDETRILAENQTEKAQTATSGGAALATGAGIVNETTIRHTTAVDLGEVAIHANASALTEAEKAAGKTLFDKNAIAIDAASHVTSKDQDVIATGSAVGAAHVKNAHHVTAETTTSVAKGASLLAGDTEEIKKEHKNEDLTNTEDRTYGKTYRGGSIGVGSKNDADLTGTTMVDVFGAAGYAGTSNEVTYDGKTKTAFGGEAETAKGDIRVASGRDSAGTIGQLNVKAKSDILNATAIPISSKKDPFAKISSDAALSMNGTLLADRDIYLQSTAGEAKATGSGEVKDWVNKVGEVFGTEGGSIGKSEVTTKATAALDGKAETGIHRNKSITISGKDEDGTWKTSVTTQGDIAFTLSKQKVSAETLSKRLAELKKELADHISDPAAKASYEAEISFVESKMVEQGLGYRAADGTFIEIDPGTQTEYDETKTMLDGMTASKDAVLEAIQKDQDAVQAEKDKMTAMGTTHTAYEAAKKETTSAENAKTQAETAFTTAENALKDKIGNNPTQEAIDAYVNDTANKDIQEVKDYKGAKDAYDEAAGALTNVQAKEAEAKTTYETAVKTAGYDPANMNEEKIRADWKALSDLQTAYANSDKTIKEDIDNLTKQVKATEDFKAQGGMERDGKFYRADGSEVEGGKWNGETLLHIIAYPHMTRDVTIEDTVSQLGDIYLEGDAITGSGTLTAHGDAKVEVKNDSPNNLILGDIKVMGKESNGQIGQGGAFYLNGNAMKGTEQLGNLTLKGRRQTEDPSVTISNTFNPNTYTKDVGEGEKAPVYAAANLQLGKGKTIYNPRGKVTVVSDYGDVYNDGSIVAGSVELTAKNGDFIQSYSNRIANIGGDPFVEDKDNGGFKKNEALGSGILANGNIFISARYVNINAKIQSGVANWALDIPETPTFCYKGTDGKLISITAEEAKTIGKDHTIYVANATGNMAENLTYDVETGRLVLGQTEVHGGKVSIVGTVINTTNDTSKARIEALDGYGSMTIDNKSKLDLELKGLGTGEGVEGVIEITDLDPKKGTPSRKTTYTRKDSKVHMLVQQYQNGSWTSGTENTFDGTYMPSADQHYVFQTGTDKSTTNTYEYHGDKFDWWGIENKTPTRDELIAMGAKLTNTVTGEEKALINGTFISGSTDTIGNGQPKEWDVLNKSDVIDYSIKTKRRWYTIGLTKKYDMKMVIRDYETHIKQYETGASNAIGIGFNGDETGRIDINQNGGAGNVAIAGTISNVGGVTAISGDAITSTSKGFLQTKALDLKATNDVGSKDQAILTSAEEVSGSAKNGNFYLNSSASDVAVGAIEAAKTVSLTSEGSLTQKADAMVKGSRVELTAETGAITGKDGTFNIQTNQGSGEEYGLKASADGDIAITNTGGDLCLDSVTSKHGDVTLTTDGSFIDNNFGDVTDGSAKEKLLAWANAAVLEGSDATVAKQKSLLKAKVMSKYNEYQSLAAYVKDGKYTLDETARAALEKNGVTDIDKYIADKQARYDALKDSVGTWTKEGVDAYRESIDNSKKEIYGKASLTKESLTDDTYLTKDEKASILVGSAKSAQDLLVTFSPGGIKEGITDTQATLKETPHVSGQNVKLTALGGKTGENASGIGHKENGQEIDLSAGNLNKLTAQELLALAAAERGDFKVNGNTVTVSSIHSIEANAGGRLTAQADQGAIYLQSAGAVNTGSSLTAAGEVRLKAKGDVNGVTIGSSEQTVIESGAGKISDVTVTGTGVLTARAKGGVSLKKSDGDLVINTVYASEGDVRLDVGENSLLAEDGHDTSGDERGTTYTNIGAENITIENVKDIKGEGENASLGMKVTGTKAKDGSETPGTITAHAKGDADITLFGKVASEAIDIEAKDLTITSRGNISNGNYQARNALRVHTAQDNTISGGNFSGGTADITNAGKMSGGAYTAKGDLTYTDSENASLSGSDFTSEEGNVKVTAKGQLALKKLSAKESATVEADRDVTLNEAEAGTLAISSGGSVNAGTLTATTGDASVTAKKDVTIGTLTAEAGSATIEATEGKLDVTTLNAKKHAELTSGSDMVLHAAEAGGTLTADAGGSISVKGTDAKIAAADITMRAGEDIRITDRSPVGKLDGVDTSLPAGQTMGSGEAGSLVIGEAKPHDFDASGKGSALLSSAGGKVTLSAKKVEIDTLANGEGSTADLTISADNIGIDDLAGTGAQHVTIHGKDGQSQAHYAGIHSTAEGGTLVKDSAVEHLALTGREPLGLSNTAIGGDSVLATDKIRVTIQKNPGSSMAEHFGDLSLNGYDIATDHVMTSVKDGVTVNGERFPMTAESVMNASLYEDRTLGRDGREKEEETEKDSPSLFFSEPNDKESYEVVK